MDFESPEVMKDFPGLYVSDINKKGNNDSDYSDDADKLTKKELLLAKRKDKKDKKDKERGYAALEGESSPDEACDTRSPSKSKKSKSFKFTSKSKEKREKSRDKDVEKKKDKEKKSDKKADKEKKVDKKERKTKHSEEFSHIAEKLPIFGVSLDLAVERSRCHDGINIPYPVRACINYLQVYGYNFEGVYKITGSKSKVIHLRKMFNNRETVHLNDYDVPTVTSLLKLFLRDLPDSILTNELLIRFEEAGAILNIGTREKHLKILIENLPQQNKLLLAWLLLHFDHIICNERLNKTSLQGLVTAVSPVLRISTRLLTALLYHCHVLFPDTVLKPYIPPLTSSAELPVDTELIEEELMKQESLLSQIHMEIHSGFISKAREEMMWEVQRIITQLKRTYKNVQKDRDQLSEKSNEDKSQVVAISEERISGDKLSTEDNESEDNNASDVGDNASLTADTQLIEDEPITEVQKLSVHQDVDDTEEKSTFDNAISLLQLKNNTLIELKEKLSRSIEIEKNEILLLRKQLQEQNEPVVYNIHNSSANLDEIMDLLMKENQILQIKKINLVRQIMEQQEICIDMKAKINILGS